MMPKTIDEARADDFNNYDRTGSENFQERMPTPDQIAQVVEDWYSRHNGKVDRPDTGNYTRVDDIVNDMIGTIIDDGVGQVWQIEDRLKVDYLYWQELASELYALISDEV